MTYSEMDALDRIQCAGMLVAVGDVPSDRGFRASGCPGVALLFAVSGNAVRRFMKPVPDTRPSWAASCARVRAIVMSVLLGRDEAYYLCGCGRLGRPQHGQSAGRDGDHLATVNRPISAYLPTVAAMVGSMGLPRGAWKSLPGVCNSQSSDIVAEGKPICKIVSKSMTRSRHSCPIESM